jgi:hypothetical protein
MAINVTNSCSHALTTRESGGARRLNVPRRGVELIHGMCTNCTSGRRSRAPRKARQ